LELCIALEALLGDDGVTELTWKVGLRSALLAGQTKAARLRVRTIVHGIYSLRSKVVHTGKTPSTTKVKQRGKMRSHDLVEEGMRVAAQVIASAIELGKLPDWFEEEIAVVSDTN
jgi:hypothetical protein